MRKNRESYLESKNGKGVRITAAIVLTAAILAAGFFMPEFAARMADQRMGVQSDTFAGEQLAMTSDARLTDMLVLVNDHDEEMYLSDGLVLSYDDITRMAQSLTKQLKEYGILEKDGYRYFSANAYLAAKGNLANAYDALGVDDNESAVAQEGAPGQDQTEQDLLMGVMWNCSGAGRNAGERLDMTIDDRSGKLLSFAFTRNRDDKEIREIYDRMNEDLEGMKQEIRSDLEQKAEELQKFCEESYGFRLERTEYHIEVENSLYFAVSMLFEDEEGNEVPLILERNLEGTWYSWN